MTTSSREATPEVSASESEDVTVVVSSMISFPFPLESGEVANLRLPKRLERRDASRLTAFINALTVDGEPPKQLPPHPRSRTETTAGSPCREPAAYAFGPRIALPDAAR